jgi:hypothetical protein
VRKRASGPPARSCPTPTPLSPLPRAVRHAHSPGKADKEAAFAAFSADITSALVEQAEEEDEDAAEAAQAREEREAYEQR